MEFEDIQMHMDAIIRGYFSIAAQTLIDAGYQIINATDIKNSVYKTRQLFKPEYHAIFDIVFAEMVDDIEELHRRGLN